MDRKFRGQEVTGTFQCSSASWLVHTRVIPRPEWSVRTVPHKAPQRPAHSWASLSARESYIQQTLSDASYRPWSSWSYWPSRTLLSNHRLHQSLRLNCPLNSVMCFPHFATHLSPTVWHVPPGRKPGWLRAHVTARGQRPELCAVHGLQKHVIQCSLPGCGRWCLLLHVAAIGNLPLIIFFRWESLKF